MFGHYRDAKECYYCRSRFGVGNPVEKDHIIAKTQGGLNWEMNYIACCRSCNRSKSGLTLPEFAEWLCHNNQNNGSFMSDTPNRRIAKRVWKLFNKTSWLHKRYDITGDIINRKLPRI